MRPAGCGRTGNRTGKVFLVDGIHDLGGMQGFAEVSYSPAEPVFRHRWEAVARALLVVVAGTVKASGGEFRHSIERMEPGHYLTSVRFDAADLWRDGQRCVWVHVDLWDSYLERS